MQKYKPITYLTSANSKRRRLCGWLFNEKTGKPEMRNRVTCQQVRDDDGEKLNHLPLLVRRNKYVPHVGKKQERKAIKQAI